ncbi:MAG: diguanylate cyclase [Rhodospirillaceae bacterium]|nr:MAG: diguanylate cyclase [Rhodospirillaceae bacterium]
MKTDNTNSSVNLIQSLSLPAGDDLADSALDGKLATPEQVLLSGYNEPAVLLNFQQGKVTLNHSAHRVKHLFEGEIDGELKRLGTQANATGRMLSATVSLSTVAGQVVYQVTVVPQVIDQNVLFLFVDQTLNHNLRDALIESRQRFKDLVEVSSDFSWEIGEEGSFQYVSRTGALGYDSDDFIGRPPEDFIVGAEEYDQIPFHTKETVEDVEIWMHRSDGSMACVQVSAKPFLDEEGLPMGVRGVCRDVTHDRERETALAQAHQREQVLGYIVNTIRDEINPIDMMSAAAAATARAMGATGCAVLRREISNEGDDALYNYTKAAEFGTGGPQQFTDQVLNFAAGERTLREAVIEGWHVIAGPCLHSGVLNGVICLWRHDDWSDDARLMVGDIAGQLGIAIEQITNHESIVRLSRTDSMTGLLNRRAFYEEELPRRFNRLALDKSLGALFFIDMDNFKLVNDVRGHQAGDEAILALKDLLYEFVRPGDLIARLGGDEFALWMDGVNDETTKVRCQHLIDAAQVLDQYSGSKEKPLGISVGIAVYHPETKETLDDLLARADTAMYDVKNHSKGGFKLAPHATLKDVNSV